MFLTRAGENQHLSCMAVRDWRWQTSTSPSFVTLRVAIVPRLPLSSFLEAVIHEKAQAWTIFVEELAPVFRGVQDAILTLLHTHLEIFFFLLGFSSPFNTIQANTSADILATEFSLEAGWTSCIVNFLNWRIQQVKMTTCTGSSQGRVSSPLLFILYTNSCTSTFPNKYEDDAALVSLLFDEEEEHGPVLNFFLNSYE